MWLKIKVWTKIVLFALLALYALIFLLKNTGRPVEFWYWFVPPLEVPMLVLVTFAFGLGVIGTLLIRGTFNTFRQVKELQARARADRLEREVSLMKSKAAMLRTREDALSPPGFPMDDLPK